MTTRHDDGPTSRIPGFYRLSPKARLSVLETARVLDREDLAVYRSAGLTVEEADVLVENVISTFALPNAVAVNFFINGEERVVPMVVEEPSVVAAVSNSARLAREGGGFTAETDPSVMIGQVQLMSVRDPERCLETLREALPRLREIGHAVHPRLVDHGGGLRDMEVRHVVYEEPGYPREDMVVLHFHLDCVDAMGANMVNTVAEHLAPHVEALTGETVGLRILSNLADRRLARASVTLRPALLGTADMEGDQVADRIVKAWRFAWADPYRAATHNKGVMNGIDAVAIATGNDWRAIEAGAHAYAARDGRYRPLTTWRLDDDGSLTGTIEVPLALGIVGGAIRVHPTVRANLRMLRVSRAQELTAIAASVGLAQNLSALRALATDGIQMGHMRMHARSVAATAGATRPELAAVIARLVEEEDISVEQALKILDEIRGG
ncbi:MAG: hydroxymethylglutaryl-CoA reductase, degradative [Deltaproteobacteria bacterium]|nr:hydroxymethylglutaryl-CoA reductase, degradative [Deltaproteobacteria bacterium]MBW2253474.1 hydroxymethylglutaryl-CoA reductase, degradative [Deltaproteobacteria bacterium]